MSRKLISFRVDAELAKAIDEAMARAAREAEGRDSEFSEPVFLRTLVRKGLKALEAERKRRKK